MPRKKKDGGSKSTKSGGKKPEEPKPEATETPEPEPLAAEPNPGTEPNPPADPPANAPTPELNRPKPLAPPLTRKQKEVQDAQDAKAKKKGKVSTATDGRRARPPMKDGKVDLDQAETWSKSPETGLLTYRFSNGATVREDEL